ncbi:ArsR/SmtB family transcription factor [Microvirga pudoricolor]|uniref:ArsR/SmtB family transcription factor n=1 Tax=Microvirga pudoricolor TaxID=2778729 RepID=UPI00194EFBC8|nr:helix-turn-helix transcriptional regulator [Microvirga pudoricolor]MBM6594302.1 helix-turn-helix transcriptional regulator [Microvirga pudoricolor]
MTEPLHPETEDMALAQVLAALGDETRLAIVGMLARGAGEPMTCSRFLHLGSKTGLSYHLAKLREAGLVRVRPEGTKRLISLRKADLDERFPGLLDSLMTADGSEQQA